MNNRRRVIVTLGVAAWPLAISAQQSKKVARIGWLTPGTFESTHASVQAFREGLHTLGYIEGKNLAIDYRFAEGKTELFPVLAADVVRLGPDCILAGGYSAIRALMRLTKAIPIVLANLDSDPVEEGIIASLARPGGNVTGLIGIQWELAGKRLELLREIAPRASRVAVLFDPRSRSGQSHVERTQVAAHKLSMQLQLLEVREPDDIDRAFNAAREGRAEAMSVIHVGLMGGERPRTAKLALQARLPTIYSDIRFTDVGGLIAYAPDTPEQYRRAAIFVDKILKGAKPADLPVEQPTKFELVINMKTAKVLGITIPQTILVRADRVIE